MSQQNRVADAVAALIYKEAAALDRRKWGEWLSCFAEDAEYWVPAWDNDSALTEDPTTEVSLIYIANRAGLEERVFRITRTVSPASIPLPRTTHLIGNIQVSERAEGVCAVAVWMNQVYRPNTHEQIIYSGFYDYEFLNGPELLIRKKKITLSNDYAETVIDIYHL
ncbi:MAG: nuclear transport factor 2 family protein [Candidatus Binataceae bacterium]|nr:nuclear transport factor 2 family protein [Candidatus Binataceae bacterium]